MKLPRRVLTIAVVLAGGLMAFSELPEILALTDNVNNDCESVHIARGFSHSCVVKDPTRQATTAQGLFNVSADGRETSAHNFLRSFSAKAPRSLLLLLVSQRK
jgi:hypothetical protein